MAENLKSDRNRMPGRLKRCHVSAMCASKKQPPRNNIQYSTSITSSTILVPSTISGSTSGSFDGLHIGIGFRGWFQLFWPLDLGWDFWLPRVRNSGSVSSTVGYIPSHTLSKQRPWNQTEPTIEHTSAARKTQKTTHEKEQVNANGYAILQILQMSDSPDSGLVVASIYTCISLYIKRERERKNIDIHINTYIYIYVHI